MIANPLLATEIDGALTAAFAQGQAFHAITQALSIIVRIIEVAKIVEVEQRLVRGCTRIGFGFFLFATFVARASFSVAAGSAGFTRQAIQVACQRRFGLDRIFRAISEAAIEAWACLTCKQVWRGNEYAEQAY